MTFQIYANYNDGTFDDMSVTDFAKIKQDKLTSFFVLKDNSPYYELFFEEGQRPIYRKRKIIKPGQGELLVILIGWQKECQQSISYIFPDYIIQHGKFKEGIFCEPDWHKYEKKTSQCDCGCK